MTDHIDKGILQIDYNFLNLPKYIKFNQSVISRSGARYVNTAYTYRADGSKVRKVYQYKDGANEYLASTTTDYLDGFRYEANTTLANPASVYLLKFVPTAEGYYNFEKNQYIYSYTDHLGNIRVSYSKNTNGSAEVLEENNFYPFGMKHEGYNAQTGNPSYNYQYNGKELQKETGWSDYGARMYMSDIGRWGVIDPLAEMMRRYSPYNYAYNNPISFIDPDGRKPQAPGEEIQATMVPTTMLMFYASGGSTNNTALMHFIGAPDQIGSFFSRMNELSYKSSGGGGSATSDPTPKSKTGPGIIERIGNLFSRLFGGKKSTSTGHAVKATIISMTLIPEGVAAESSGAAIGTGLFSTAGLTAGALFWPTMIGEPEFNWTRQFDTPTDIPITTTGKPDPTITLYRGVSSRIFHNDNSQYMNAHLGIAIPKGYYQVSTLFGPHADMEAHADSDNYSIWTSWTTSKETARDFATGIAFGKGVPGIIMSKAFKVGFANPNPFTLGENEWLVPGVTYGAKVEYVLPRPGQ